MAWRGIVLVGVALAGLFAALKAPSLVFQGALMVSCAMLGILAVRFVARKAPSVPLNPRIAALTDRLQALRRLAAAARRAPFEDLEGDPETIRIDPWLDEEDVQGEENSTIAERLAERLAPPAIDSVTWGTHGSDREMLAELLREGEDLRLLGQLLNVNLNPYGNELAKGLAAARLGRLDRCRLALQLANERLRTQIHDALTEELLTLRSSHPARGRASRTAFDERRR